MNVAELLLKDDSGRVVETIKGAFEPDDLALFQRFVTAMSRVRTCTLLARGMPGLGNIKWCADSGLSLECAPYSDAELHELLHVLRPLILQTEVASFDNVAARLSRRFANRNFSDHLKILRRVFEHGELSLYMQLSIGAQPLFHKSMLDTWLNGEQYHTNEEKAATWQDLRDSLQTESARALVMAQLQGKVKALFNLEYLVRLTLDKTAGKLI